MKPGFALRLDHDAVSLLVRVTEGWAELGRAQIADPGFEDQLAELRAQAADLAPDGFSTKLILPADQILYSSIDAPGPDDTARRAQIAAALEGRTPYAVDDLVFDWSGEDGNLSVAVVARLTLDEAEDFAESHGFNPVTFVAMPETGQFAGEPFFGKTTNATAHLSGGDGPMRDSEPVRIVDAPLPAPQTATAPNVAPETVETPGTDGPPVAAGSPAEDEPDGPPSGNTGQKSRADAVPESLSPKADATGTAPGNDTPQPSAPTEGASAAEEPSGADQSSDEPLPETQKDAPKRSRGGLGITDGLVPDAAAELSETDLVMAEAADPLDDDLAGALGPEPGAADSEAPFIAVDDLPEIEDMPGPTPVAPAFTTRRQGTADATSTDAVRPSAVPAVTHGLLEQDGVDTDRPVPANDEAAPQVAGSLRGGKPPLQRELPDTRHGTAAQLRAERAMPEPKRTEKRAAPFAPPTPTARRSGARLGLAIVLVSALVLLMAAVSLWSFWFAAAPAPEENDEVIVAAPAPAAPNVEAPETAATAVSERQLSTGSPVAEPAQIDPPAADTIWADNPDGPTPPAADATGAPVISDAAAPDLAVTETEPLAAPSEAAADAALPLQPLPPPFGTEFDFRPDGLIRATAEGVVTPDGITLIAGRPPVVPAPRPSEIAPAPAPIDAAPADDSAADPQTAPEDIAPDDADASIATPVDGAVETAQASPLPPPVDPAHAALKPRARPAAVVALAAERAAREAAEAEALARAIASATPQAVATSQRPKARPKGLVRVVATPQVDDAVAAAMASSIAATVPVPAPTAAPSQPEEVDEPEPVAATPNIPTSTTVAKQATVANAINLRNINLIGVYGSSSSRRALVRMGNGRYVKVKIGDRLDGGQVAAIGDRELSYVKSGRTIVLKIEG